MSIPTLFKITPEPFGLDLSDGSVKIAKLSKKKDGLFLEGFGEADIEKGLVEDGVILSEEKLAKAIQGVISNPHTGSFKSPYVVCSLPEQKTYLRVVQLPKIKKSEIQEAIQWEIEANFPMSLSDVYFDWELIPAPKSQSDHLDIVISTVQRDLVESYSSLLYKAGLKPFSFEPESIALMRSLIRRDPTSKPIILVDLGQARTSFIIYAGGGIRFTSSTQISSSVITENIMRALKIDMEEAERLKQSVGLNRSEDERVFEAIVPAMTDLKQQISKYINFYASHIAHVHGDNSGIEKIMLTGGGSLLKGIEKYLTLGLKIKTERANPWINIFEPPLRETPELPYHKSIRYATALGLALTKY